MQCIWLFVNCDEGLTLDTSAVVSFTLIHKQLIADAVNLVDTICSGIILTDVRRFGVPISLGCSPLSPPWHCTIHFVVCLEVEAMERLKTTTTTTTSRAARPRRST